MAEAEKQTELTKDVGTGPGCLAYVARGFMLGIVIVVALLAVFCLQKLEPWEIGIRYWNFTIPVLAKKGDATTLEPGYNIIVPFLHQINKYDGRVQRLDLELEARTARDQDEIKVLVTILFHLNKDKATELRKHYSNNNEILEKGIKNRCPQIIQAKLGEIETAYQFYSSSKKPLIEMAKRQMNIEFQDRGVEIFDVLIRDFKFKDEIEASIISKVIADERVEMETAVKEAAKARAEWQRLVAEGNAAAEAELARGTAEAVKLDAGAEKYMTEKVAAGDRLIMEAEAEGKGRINRALAGRGGRTYVGLEYAKALDGIELIVLPAGGPEGVNPLDLDKTVDTISPGRTP